MKQIRRVFSGINQTRRVCSGINQIKPGRCPHAQKTLGLFLLHSELKTLVFPSSLRAQNPCLSFFNLQQESLHMLCSLTHPKPSSHTQSGGTEQQSFTAPFPPPPSATATTREKSRKQSKKAKKSISLAFAASS
jgi:hypothetical protein